MAPHSVPCVAPPSSVLALDEEEILAVLSPPPSPCSQVDPVSHGCPAVFVSPHRPVQSPFPRELPVILTICSHSLVPTSWWRSSSSTTSQLSRPHLYREGTYGRGQPQQVPSSLGAGARRWAAHSLMKCCASSRLRKTRVPCVTVLTRFSSCWQSFGAMASALGKHNSRAKSGIKVSGRWVGQHAQAPTVG